MSDIDGLLARLANRAKVDTSEISSISESIPPSQLQKKAKKRKKEEEPHHSPSPRLKLSHESGKVV